LVPGLFLVVVSFSLSTIAKNLSHLSLKVIFQNRWRKNTKEELAKPGSPGKLPLKWS